MKSIKRFNFSDFVIVFALLVIVCGLIFRQPAENIIDDLYNKANISYEVEIDGIGYNDLKSGIEIFDARENTLGIIKNVKTNSEKNTTILVIETEGKHNSRGNYIGDSIFVAAGKKMDFCLKNNKVFSALVKKVQYSA